jgi:hypothetical protein
MSTYNTEDSPDSLAVGDFNGDLRDDIAVSHANSQSLALYQQQEDGTFAEPISHDVRSGGFNVLASGDLNGDGYDDLVLLRGAGASEEQLAIFYQAAGGLSELIPRSSGHVLRTVDDDTYLCYAGRWLGHQRQCSESRQTRTATPLSTCVIIAMISSFRRWQGKMDTSQN